MTNDLSRSFFNFSASVAVGLCLIATATADTIHDTTGSPDDVFILSGLSNSGSGNINQPADSFVVSGGSFTLDTITLDLDDTSLTGGGAGNYEVRVWDNNVDRPGTLLESITIPDSDNLPGGDTTISSTLNVLLSGGSTYWVSVALPDDMSFGLVQTVQAVTNGRAVAFSGSALASWVPIPSSSAFRMKVTGTLVPEPAGLALVGIALFGTVLVRRRWHL